MIHNGKIKEKKRVAIGGYKMMLMLVARTDSEVRKCIEQNRIKKYDIRVGNIV